MNLEKYPKILEKLEDKELELRHLLSIDENYFDLDEDEIEFDPTEYNYLIYIAEPISNILKEAKLEKLLQTLENKKEFENFLATDIDLFGVKTDLKEEEIADLILKEVECLI